MDRRTGEALQLRLWLSPSDAVKLRDLAVDDEGPAETIRRLIRMGALVQPILAAIQGEVAIVAPPAVRLADDVVRWQMNAMAHWADDD